MQHAANENVIAQANSRGIRGCSRSVGVKKSNLHILCCAMEPEIRRRLAVAGADEKGWAAVSAVFHRPLLHLLENYIPFPSAKSQINCTFPLDAHPVTLAPMPGPKTVARTFDAVLERGANNLGWTVIRVPFDVVQVWGKRGQLRVSGEINGFAFRTSLFPTGKGSHILLVNKTMQKGANARAGMKAKFRLEPYTAPRPVTAPIELPRVLGQPKPLYQTYETFN